MKILHYLSTLLVLVIVTGAICFISGIRINTSGSIPYGIYKTTDRSLKKGDFVLFCPPPEPVFSMARDRDYLAGGLCPGGYGYMMEYRVARDYVDSRIQTIFGGTTEIMKDIIGRDLGL